MKTNLSFIRSSMISGVTILAGFILPVSSNGQGRPLSPARYNTQDASSDVTVGPAVNLQELANKPSASGGGAGAEVFSNRFRMLRPPVQDTGLVVDRAPVTAFATDATKTNFRGFTGLTHLDQRLARGGNQFSTEPPDHGLAVGNGFVVQAINSAINVYDTTGVQLLVRPLALTELFGLPAGIDRTTGVLGVFPGDVSCLFDPETQRWFVIAWAQLNTKTGAPLRQSRLYLAVSQTSDPTGAFSIYTFNTTNASNPDKGGPRVPDFPHFAVDHYGLYISSNEFGIDTSGNLDGFIDAAIIAVSKNALINQNGGTPPRVVRFGLPFAAGFEFDVFPAFTPPGSGPVLSNGGTQYFVSSEFVKNNEHQMAVWALTNTSSLGTDHPALDLKAVAVDTQPYHYPVMPVEQKPGFRPLGMSLNDPLEKLDAGDFRVISAEFVSGRLWATINSEMLDAKGDLREVGAYFAFTPSIQGQFLTASVATQGVVAQTGLSCMYPAIAVNAAHQGGIVFTLVGPNKFPSAAFVSVNGNTVSPIHLAREGNEPDDGFSGYHQFGGVGVARWGDYSAAAVNTDGTIWMGTEYTPDLARTSLANWATYITTYQP